MGPSIAIAGAGLSGLCLAQALVRHGVDVQVYERDPSPDARRQGYRITVNEHGIDALRTCLPSHLFELVIATAGEPKGSFRYLTSDLREVFSVTFPEEPPGAEPRRGRQVDRLTLRTLLLSGIQDRVHFGKAAASATSDATGATLTFADGDSIRADVVVAADGVGSSLRAQLLPRGAIRDLGSVAICGRTPVVDAGRPLVPTSLQHTGVLAAGAPGHAFFFTTMHFREPPEQAFARLAPDQRPPFSEDYVMWAVLLPTADWSTSPLSLHADALHDLARAAAREFHPVLGNLVEHADAETTLAVPIRAAPRPRHWRPSHVTMMGDAGHAMPPFGANGGNTALRDAALLSERLRDAAARGWPLVAAIERYQAEMVGYAFTAVDDAVSSMKRLNSRNPVTRWVMHRVLPWWHERKAGHFALDAEARADQ